MKRYRFNYEKNRGNLRKLKKNISKSHFPHYKDKKKILSIFSNPSEILSFFSKLGIPFVIVLDEKIIYFNEAFYKFFEYDKPEEVSGKSVFDFIIPEYRNRVKKNFLKRIEGKTKFVRYFAKGITKNGNLISGIVNGYLFEVKGEKYLVSLIYNKTLEFSLREDIFLFRNIVENLPLSVVVTNSVPEIEYVNNYFEEITGYSFKEALGKNPNILKSGLTPQNTYEELWGSLINGDMWKGEFINKKKNGELYLEEALIFPLEDGEKKYIGIKSDKTEERSLEVYEINNKILKKITNFSGEVSHFLRDTIQGLNFLKILMEKNPEVFKEKFKNFIGEIDKFKNRIEIYSGEKELSFVRFKDGLKKFLNKYEKKYGVMRVIGNLGELPDFRIAGIFLDEILNNVHIIFNEKIKGAKEFLLEAKSCYGPGDEEILEWEEIKKLEGRNFVLLKFTFPCGEVSDEDFSHFLEPFLYVGGGEINSEITTLYIILDRLKGSFIVKKTPLTFLIYIPFLKEGTTLKREIEVKGKYFVFSDEKDFSSNLLHLLRSFNKLASFIPLSKVKMWEVNPEDKVFLIGDVKPYHIDEISKKVSLDNVVIISENENLNEKYPQISFFKYRPKFYYLLEKLRDWL